MKTMIKPLGLLFALALLLSGCGSSGSSGTAAPPAGALEVGGSGLPIDQVVDGTGTAVTANFSVAIDINDSLEVIGYAALAQGSPFVAALWDVNADGEASVAPVALASFTPGGFAAAFAIDELGNVVGQADDGDRLVATIWKNGAGPVALPNILNAAATSTSKAYGISADGTLIVGEAQDATGRTRGVIWIADAQGDFVSSAQVLPFAAFAVGSELSRFSSASGVAKIGATEILVVGEAEAGDLSMRAALWRSTNSGATFAASSLGTDYLAYSVNSSRQAVGENDSTLAPVRWSINADGVASAPESLGTSGSAVDINDNGRVAGWTGAVTPLATVWSGTTPATISTQEGQAYGLNNDTQPLVVGHEGGKGFVKRAN